MQPIAAPRKDYSVFIWFLLYLYLLINFLHMLNKKTELLLTKYLAGGMTLEVLAEKTGLSLSTVKGYIANRRSAVWASRTADEANPVFAKGLKQNEEWKKIRIPTNHRYEISNYGRVKSYALTEVKFINGKLTNGYYVIDMFDTKAKMRRSRLVHRLVAEYFLDKPKAAEKSVIHLDGNKSNNHYKNLRWVTTTDASKMHISNADMRNAMMERNRNRVRGTKLHVDQVDKIRLLIKAGKHTQKQIAAQFDVSEMQIYRIKSGELWKDKGKVKL
jgi:DNA-binding CsgD family transcriptional regulator